MASSHHFWLLLLPYLAGIHFSTQDEVCVPGSVVNLTFTGHSILSWEKSDKEECEISFYLVYVSLSDGSVKWEYTVTETSVDVVDHIDPCANYIFRVHQVTADNLTSIASSISISTPPAQDANLRVDYVRTRQTGVMVHLQWALEDKEYISCVMHYRVVVYNADNDYVRDIYTAAPSTIAHNIVPCAHYTFAVSGIFSLRYQGPATVIGHTANAMVADAPGLEKLTVADTSATFSWLLEEYDKNRCPINNLILDASPYFNVTYTIRNQANRTPLPLRLTELAPDTLYYLKVTANNTAGPSEPFQLGIQTLPSS